MKNEFPWLSKMKKSREWKNEKTNSICVYSDD